MLLPPGLKERFLLSLCTQAHCKTSSVLNCSLKGPVVPRNMISVGDKKPSSLAFSRWDYTSSHQLGMQPDFIFLLTSESFYWVFTRLLMLAMAMLHSHSWLSFADPGELLNNLWGVCQIDRKELPWISPVLFALLLRPPGSNRSRN